MTVLLKSCVLFFAMVLAIAANALDRQSFTFTQYNLKITIDPAKQGFTATGSLQARNDSNVPQKNLVMQVSSSLHWASVRVGKDEVPWVQQSYTTDIDHTGEVSEAILTLTDAVAPGARVTVNF